MFEQLKISERDLKHVEAYAEYRNIVGDTDNGALLSEQEYARLREKAAEAKRDPLLVYWRNDDGLDCRVIGPSSSCMCGHRYRDHDWMVTDTKNVMCRMRSCPCPLFTYIPVHGSGDIKCRCKHSYLEHNPLSKVCEKCVSLIGKGRILCNTNAHNPVSCRYQGKIMSGEKRKEKQEKEEEGRRRDPMLMLTDVETERRTGKKIVENRQTNPNIKDERVQFQCHTKSYSTTNNHHHTEEKILPQRNTATNKENILLPLSSSSSSSPLSVSSLSSSSCVTGQASTQRRVHGDSSESAKSCVPHNIQKSTDARLNRDRKIPGANRYPPTSIVGTGKRIETKSSRTDPCSYFSPPFTCSCGKNYAAHQTVFERASERGEPPPRPAMQTLVPTGGLAGLTSLLDGVDRLWLSQRQLPSSGTSASNALPPFFPSSSVLPSSSAAVAECEESISPHVNAPATKNGNSEKRCID